MLGCAARECETRGATRLDLLVLDSEATEAARDCYDECALEPIIAADRGSDYEPKDEQQYRSGSLEDVREATEGERLPHDVKFCVTNKCRLSRGAWYETAAIQAIQDVDHLTSDVVPRFGKKLCPGSPYQSRRRGVVVVCTSFGAASAQFP